MAIRNKKLILIFFIILVLTILVILNMPEHVDTIYINGKIYTIDADNSIAEAIAISGDRIAGVGSSKYILRKFSANDTINLEGKTVLPGLIDAHCHLLGLGLTFLTVDLRNTKSEKEVVHRISKFVLKSKPGQWIRGHGWDQNDWDKKSFPTSELLDKVAPENPIYLTRIDGHACWVNKKAMKIAGINKHTVDPQGGKIIRDNVGEPTGVFIDSAMELVYRFLPPPSDLELEEAIRLADKECVSYGITSVQEMGIDLKQFELYKKMIDEDKLSIRLYGAVDGQGDLWNKLKETGPIVGYGKNKLTVRALKLYVDGALGSRGAALIEPYSDDPNNRGLTVLSEQELQSLVDEALKYKFQVCTHAIGDRANHIILNVYESALKKYGISDNRLRIEHAQVLKEEDIPRFKRLNVIPSMQPVQCISDMYWAEARLGAKRVRRAYAWRSLLDTGVIIAGGSDFPVENPNPFLGIYAACTRRDVNGKPKNYKDVMEIFDVSNEGISDSVEFENGWYVSQRMTREEAVKSFTVWAAYSAFEEDIKGSIEKGKLADFIIISDDIFTCPDSNIPDIKVLRTYIGGKEVYRR